MTPAGCEKPSESETPLSRECLMTMSLLALAGLTIAFSFFCVFRSACKRTSSRDEERFRRSGDFLLSNETVVEIHEPAENEIQPTAPMDFSVDKPPSYDDAMAKA
ncbi:Oidioi.mRNA.OKI2018_I69.PAR.g8748.t1.cds [Oikopleura dioica]|uniref:Oidioi.mRNA.OKI2018_I69.PAR.g8748.t1.cds n=1 Tax=Oikopleura dioica TaxID=34765 RepID=A0ABN7RNC4_OIKDI|nr:Oidioi.mRNA.OKI2018_I69.PAR.g8748.t1.cds [Oikopleura dioica]